MSEAYIGEIRLVGFTFAPQGWLLCQGQLISIQENTTLYNLLGTTYGGDGVNTFGLPDLQGRTPISAGTDRQQNAYVLGQKSGSETVTLVAGQIPPHTHPVAASTQSGVTNGPSGQTFACNATVGQYDSSSNGISGSVLGPSAGGQAHDNLMPFQTINYIICLYGTYPSPS